MKGGNKILSKCLTLYIFILFTLLILPLKAEDEKFGSNKEQGKDSKKKNNTIIKAFSIYSANKSLINFKLSKSAKNKDKNRKIKFNLEQNKTYSFSSSSKLVIRPNKSQKVEQSLFTTSLITLLALNTADYFLTIKALKYKDLKERNPIVKPFVKRPPLYLFLKLSANVLYYHSMRNLHKKHKGLAWLVSAIANFALSYIVVNNIRQINKAK